jgi:hypothetical protein
MTLRVVDKATIAQLLEATKTVLDHIGRWQIDVSNGLPMPPEKSRELSQTYGSVRRIRDYLQRCVAAFPLPQEIELDEPDINLLATCAVHEVGVIESRLTGNVSIADRRWNEDKLRNLSRWAEDHATRPIERLPSPEALRNLTPFVRELVGRIRQRTAPRKEMGPNEVGGSRIIRGYQFHPGAPPRTPSSVPEAASPTQRAMATPAPAPEPAPAPAAAPAAPAPGAMPIGAGFASLGGYGGPQLGPSVALLDAGRLREPRLRSIAAMELVSFDRSYVAQDHRMAVIHLVAILEIAILDYALLHRQQLGLSGSPETWRLEEVLLQIVGERINTLDRAFIQHLFSVRAALRPALQLTNPMVVTPQTVVIAMDFVRRVLYEFGILAGSGMRPSNADAVAPA